MYNMKKIVITLLSICFLCMPLVSFAEEVNSEVSAQEETQDLGGKHEGNFIFGEYNDISSIDDAIAIVKADIREQEESEIEKEEEQKKENNKPKQEVVKKVDLSKDAKKMITYMKGKNRSLSDSDAQKIYNSVMKYTKSYGVEPTLVFAIMEQESTFKPSTVYQGAYGLMQIYHTTFSYLGVTRANVMDIDTNIGAGVREISGNIKMFGNYTTALSAYNWGSGNVKRGTYNTKYANSVLNRKSKIESYLQSK